MPAWEVKKTWTPSQITSYRSFVAAEAPKRAGSLRSTCEDLALRLVIEFAEQQGLPIGFKNGANSGGLTPESFSTSAAFIDRVLTTTAASDLLTYKTAVLVAGAAESKTSSLNLASRGDLIILYRGGHHVQVVTAAGPAEIKIAQGNFRPKAERCSAISRVWYGNNQNQPGDSCYIGAMVRNVGYVFDKSLKDWKYNNGQADVFKDHGRLSIWDFDAWNKLVQAYTVRPDDSLSLIAQQVYGDGNQWNRIYQANKSVIGNNSDHVRAGQVLHIWT